MENTKYIAEAIFKEHDLMRYPITKSCRLSFGLENERHSTPSEFKSENLIEPNKKVIISFIIIETDFLNGKIKIGSEFSLGLRPFDIAEGKIIEIIE